MDNSKEFNLMLDKAIQSEPEGFIGFDRTKNVQDQLQEMIEITPPYKANLKRRTAILTLDFAEYVEELSYKEIEDKTREQLWLAFVMKEKYNKILTGEDWVESVASAPTGIGSGGHEHL